MDVINKKFTIQDVMSSVQITFSDDLTDFDNREGRISVLGSPFVGLSSLTVMGHYTTLEGFSLVVQTMADMKTLSNHLGREIVKANKCDNFTSYKLEGGRDQISVCIYKR
jgi:hypothetical protein